ncbi:MAG: FecR family protein [Myxococcota bacterium]
MNRAFDERADEALNHLRTLEWSDARTARVRRGMFRKQRRRRVQRAAGASAVALTAALAAVFVTTRPVETPAVAMTETPTPAPFAVDAEGVVRFADGSTATPASADALLRVERHSPRAVEVGLLAGAARFEVTPGRDRRFTVQAGAARVEVLGTAFEVTRGEGDVRVAVTRGVVRVAWDGGHHTLRRGEAGTFPPAMEPLEAAAAPEKAEPARTRRPARTLDWRALAEAGELEEAYANLGNVRETATDLWAAADVARRAGHAAEAVPYLERLLEVAPRSRQAQNAAFTLGRVLGGLGRHDEAAAAYGEAAERAGALREAALYRQVQALRTAGRTAAADTRAELYRERFPEGRYTTRLD